MVSWSGPEGVARISFGIPQEIQLRHREGNVDTWRPIEGDPMIPDDTMDSSNQRLVDDLMSAIANGGGLVVSAHRAMKAQEMIAAVYASGLSGERVALPLADRTHPLE